MRNGPWTAWVRRDLASAHDCTLALELYGVDPDARWPAALLQSLASAATSSVDKRRPLAAQLANRELELTVALGSASRALFSEAGWGRALVDLRPDRFGGAFELDGVTKTIIALLPLTVGEWILRQEGASIGDVRELHEALDRDVLASPRWREAWHGEAGGSRPDWLARQSMIRRRVDVADGSWGADALRPAQA